MKTTSTTDRIIFGLKTKQLRLKKQMSFAELAAATGMSLSYLNEIEKGKKFPKQDKIESLAKALDSTPDNLTNGRLDRHLAPIENLLRSKFLNELPLDLFGLDLSKVVELIANAPVRVAAFISTLLELSRSYNQREENFYFAALRSYLELHDNYFPDLEQAADELMSKHQLPTARPLDPNTLSSILENEYGYQISKVDLEKPTLRRLRAVFLPESKQLLLQQSLTPQQAAFQLGKELAFNSLQLGDRANTSSLLNARSFEEVINHSKATYFSAALMLPLLPFSKEIEDFFNQSNWNGAVFLNFLDRYNVNPETFFHRLTNVIPHSFNFADLFFLRIVHDPKINHFVIDRELHLDSGEQGWNDNNQDNYCRYWIGTDMLLDLEQTNPKTQGEAANGEQLSIKQLRYAKTEPAYLCISLFRRDYPKVGKNVSTILGLTINDQLRSFCRWLNDPAIPVEVVNITSEQYTVIDPNKRLVPPNVHERNEHLQSIQEWINTLDEQSVES